MTFKMFLNGLLQSKIGKEANNHFGGPLCSILIKCPVLLANLNICSIKVDLIYQPQGLLIEQTFDQ